MRFVSGWNDRTPSLSYIRIKTVKDKVWTKIQEIGTALPFLTKPLPTVVGQHVVVKSRKRRRSPYLLVHCEYQRLYSLSRMCF